MQITYSGKVCIETDTNVYKRLLSFYPEEKLLQRPILAEALQTETVTYGDLCSEAEKLFIPWQMFLLTPRKLTHHLKNIENNRVDKIRSTQMSRRRGHSGDIPYRLIDRYIRAQNFVSSTGFYGANTYNGSLAGLTIASTVKKIMGHFGIERGSLLSGTKADVLQYLITRIEEKCVNVGIGALEARLVPTTDNHRDLYKNVSGFCLRDEKVPFIYVNASMATEEEPVGRQIYTLIYLLTLIGLDEFTLARNINPRTVETIKGGNSKLVHAVTAELLMPESMFETFRGVDITLDVVNLLSNRFKVTPSAVLMRLYRLGIISRDEKSGLTTEPFVKRSGGGGSSPITTAVKKFNGGLVTNGVNRAFNAQSITQNHAQYILFGRIGRPTWRDYRKLAGI